MTASPTSRQSATPLAYATLPISQTPRRKRSLVVSAMMGVALASMAVLYMPMLRSPSAKKLADVEYKRLARLKIETSNEASDKATALARADKAWSRLRLQMQRKRASLDEIQGVLKSARRHFSYRSPNGGFSYGYPRYAKRVWADHQRVWVIALGWGAGYDSTRMGFTESPIHIRVLVIQARRPFKILAWRSCG